MKNRESNLGSLEMYRTISDICKNVQDINPHGCIQCILLLKATSLHFKSISITMFYISFK